MSWANDLAMMMAPEHGVGRGLQLATMSGPTSLAVGDLALEGTDLLFAEHLLKPVATKVSGTCPADGGALGDTSTYIPALQAGDQVLVLQISMSKFLVIEKVVSAE